MTNQYKEGEIICKSYSGGRYLSFGLTCIYQDWTYYFETPIAVWKIKKLNPNKILEV